MSGIFDREAAAHIELFQGHTGTARNFGRSLDVLNIRYRIDALGSRVEGECGVKPKFVCQPQQLGGISHIGPEFGREVAYRPVFGGAKADHQFDIRTGADNICDLFNFSFVIDREVAHAKGAIGRSISLRDLIGL